ncbi:MAG: hypothetical protein U0168_28490 [Nannocystaceae bacterium]
MPKTDGDLFEVFAAPGSHELALSANLVARRDATYKIRIDYAIWFAVDANMRFPQAAAARTWQHVALCQQASRCQRRAAAAACGEQAARQGPSRQGPGQRQRARERGGKAK